MTRSRFIVHVDMDAFFAAIEQRDNPALRGKPVVIGADPRGGKGRGVVSTASYEARKFGIHSAMPISFAYRRCPKAIFLGVDMEKYSNVSDEIYKVFDNFTPQIEPVGIDEAFLDITDTYHLFGTPRKACLLIKEKIKKEFGLTASLGLAPTKMAAKIASDLKKPDGLVEVSREGLLDFLWPLTVDKIWGLGGKSKVLLNDRGIITIGDLAQRDVRELTRLLGKAGVYFWRLANGIDESEVEREEEAKSLSNEVTFEKDTYDARRIEAALMLLSEKVSYRLRRERLKGRTITLKIRLEGFDTYTRANTIPRATNFSDVIFPEIKLLYDNFKKKSRRVRLVGVRVSNLVPAGVREDLFEEKDDEKKEKVHRLIDKIKDKFGSSAIQRARARMHRM